jgi:energy-coupling factor transporter ATP-binding protein EcfA2
VYQYGNETLQFGGGRLLLRGVNGSGKSTAMNMLLPFLVDADTRRIDAAGEQSAVLRSWMLSGREEQQPVGYLWIEFTRAGDEPEQQQYLVCGCGIKANRSTDRVTTWWFVTDRRPGVDLALMEGRVPLSVDALRAELGPHAVFAQDQRAAYRQAIRDALFGGGDLDQHILPSSPASLERSRRSKPLRPTNRASSSTIYATTSSR